MHAKVEQPDHPLLARLAAAAGTEHVLTDRVEREFYSTDIYRAGQLPLAVVRPATPEQVAEVVRLVTSYDLSVVARGGGASYTDGYLPTEADAIVIDTARLDRIVEINERDMYVVVEAGVTWARLNDALKEKGLRTPFFGPFSGVAATVGGSTSQGSVSWGSGRNGVSGENVLAVEVVTASGDTVRTGAWGAANSVPFFRSYGPDLTGLFMGDCGALGVKTRLALPLERRPECVLGLSFGFRDFASMAAGMEAAAKEELCLISFGLDPTLQQGQLGKATVATGLQSAAAVFRSSRNLMDGMARVVRIGLAGRGFLKGATFSAHWIVEGIDMIAVRAHAGRLREVLQPHGAEVASTVPTVVNAMPFMPLGNVRGPRGERWVPIHGILPYSRVLAFRAQLEGYYARYAERMREHKVIYGAMFTTIRANAFLYEPVFYWHDVTNVTQERLAPPGYLGTLPQYAENLAGRALVDEMKHGIADLFQQHGAVHLQIGKFYPYMRGRESGAAALVRDIKQLVDPQRRLNPGALGL